MGTLVTWQLFKYLSLLDEILQGSDLHLCEDLHLTAQVLHPGQEIVRDVEGGFKAGQQLGPLPGLTNTLEKSTGDLFQILKFVLVDLRI